MKDKIVLVKNLHKLAKLGESLKVRGQRAPGIGVVFGDTGVGKTTGLTWYGVRKERAVYVRALQLWTPSVMLHAIASELDVEPSRNLADTVNLIVGELARTGPMIIVDEADYVVDQKRLINTLRDLHDLSTMPVILVGMGDFVRKINTRSDQRQFTGRVAFEVEFTPLDFDDTRLLATELLEDRIEADEDLLKKLHDVCEGSTRLVYVGLQRIEDYAKSKGVRKVTLKEWGERPLNLMGVGQRANRIARDTLK